MMRGKCVVKNFLPVWLIEIILALQMNIVRKLSFYAVSSSTYQTLAICSLQKKQKKKKQAKYTEKWEITNFSFFSPVKKRPLFPLRKLLISNLCKYVCSFLAQAL